MTTPAPILAQVWRYPLKSAAGVEAQGLVHFDRYGLEFDHRFMVVDESDGVFCSQRKSPQMARISCTLDEHRDRLEIHVPGAEAIVLPLSDSRLGEGPRLLVSVHEDHGIIAMDQRVHAPDAAGILSEFLGQRVLLVRIAPESNRCTPTGDPIAFHDGWPVLGASLASLAAVNGWLVADGHAAVDMRRFRPQLVFDRCTAFAEDAWSSFAVGRAWFGGMTHCRRCSVPDVDPDSGVQGKGVAKVLLRHRRRRVGNKNELYFGRNMTILRGNFLRVGDPVATIEHDGGLIVDLAA